MRELGANGRALADGVNAEKLIPDLGRRFAARRKASAGSRMNDMPQTEDADAFDPAAHGWEEISNHTAFGDLVGPIWRREETAGRCSHLPLDQSIAIAPAICMAAC